MPLTSAAVGALTLLFVFGLQERQFQGATVETTLPMSPSVLATFIAHGEPSSFPPRISSGEPPPSLPRETMTGPLTLDLLVLWRGSPGWFLKGDHTSGSGGGDQNGRVNVHMERGGLALDLTLDRQTRTVQVAGNEVVLGEANVVLVDGVDGPGGLTIAGTRSVDSRIDALPNGAYALFRAAPELVPFLRCDARLEDLRGQAPPPMIAYAQQVLGAACAQITAK